MKKLLFFSLIFAGTTFVNAQKIQLRNVHDQKVLILNPKKIRSIVSINGEFFEGRPKVGKDKLVFGDRYLPLSEIGILEVKKTSFRKVVGFPFKWIGLASAAGGALMTSAYVSDADPDADAALGIAGVCLLSFGVSSMIVSKKVAPPKSKTLRSFHVKDWRFAWVER